MTAQGPEDPTRRAMREHQELTRVAREHAALQKLARERDELTRTQRELDAMGVVRQYQALARHAETERGHMDATLGTGRLAATLAAEYERIRRQLGGLGLERAALGVVRDFGALGILGAPARREWEAWEAMRRRMSASHAASAFSTQLLERSSIDWFLNLQTLTASYEAALNAARLSGAVDLPARLAAPSLAFSAFARESLQRAASASPDERPALERAIALGEEQLLSGTAAVTAFLDPERQGNSGEGVAPSAEGEPVADVDPATGAEAPPVQQGGGATLPDAVSFASEVTVFDAQRVELFEAHVSADATAEELLEASPTARALAHARSLVGLVVEIDEARHLATEGPVFPPTTAIVRAVNTLGFHRVHDRSSFGEAVDQLYILLYEGSGSMQRVVPGLLPDVCCAPMWRLKHLRNYWLRHDPEHGDAGQQRKKHAALRETLGALGFDARPRTPAEYALLYERLLAQLVSFAESLLTSVLTAGRA